LGWQSLGAGGKSWGEEEIGVTTEFVLLDKTDSGAAWRYALIALAVFLISESISTLIFRYCENRNYLEFVILISIKTLIFWWIVPLLIVYKIENRDIKFLGLVIARGKYLIYALYAFAALIIPLILLGYKEYYPMEFVEQILYIGFPEEVFYRGFLMTRMCQWLGKYKGLLAASLIFGFGHIVSRLADQGFGYFFPATYIGLQTFFGGLIFGYIYIRAKNIWPSGILHVSTNMYIQDMISTFTS